MNIINELKSQITNNFFENPRYDLKVYDFLIRDSFLELIAIFGSLITFLNVIFQYIHQYPVFPFIDFITFFMFLILYLLKKFKIPHKYIVIALFMIFTYVLFFSIVFFKRTNNDFIIIMILPLAIYNILGTKQGTSWSVLSVLVFAAITFASYLKIVSVNYSNASLSFFLIFLIAITVISYFSELRRSTIQELLLKKMYYDDDSLLGNRKMLSEDIDMSIYPCLFILKVNGFEEINRFLGYRNGMAFSKFLVQRLNDFQAVYQMKFYTVSAGEFAMLINFKRNEAKIDAEISDTGERLFSHFTEIDFTYKNSSIPVTIHIGAAHQLSSDKVNLITKAGTALQHAIDLNIPYYFLKNGYEIPMYNGYFEALSELNHALQNDGIIPYYQPILCNKTGEIVKYECLMRIRNSMNVIEKPARFLEAARRTRLHDQITEQMFIKVFDFIKDKDYMFALNISAHDIQNKNFIVMLRKLTERYPENSGKIILEIIESESIDKLSEIKSFLEEVKILGYKIAIDDFGSGYSNFTNIFNLEPDFIKFDGSLIKDINNNVKTKILIKNLSRVCRELNIKTIAEFVENQDILDIIKEFRINYSQGFHIGKPADNVS